MFLQNVIGGSADAPSLLSTVNFHVLPRPPALLLHFLFLNALGTNITVRIIHFTLHLTSIIICKCPLIYIFELNIWINKIILANNITCDLLHRPLNSTNDLLRRIVCTNQTGGRLQKLVNCALFQWTSVDIDVYGTGAKLL